MMREPLARGFSMTTLQVPIEESTLRRARVAAIKLDETLENMIVNMVEELAQSERTCDPVFGLFDEDADLIDAIVDDAYLTRQNPMRLADAEGSA
jgi:hypothetical protein